MEYIIRELSKLCMFTVTWGIPVYLYRCTGNCSFLWLFIVSFIVMCVMFTHYAEICKWECWKAHEENLYDKNNDE